MKPIVMELLVFAAFIAVALIAHLVTKHAERKRAEAERKARDAGEVIDHTPLLRRLVRKHAPKFLIFVGSGLAHPVTLHAVHEYSVHFVVYSGYVIKAGH